MSKPKAIETELVINAPAQRVWDVLMKSEAWKDWNPSFCYVGGPFKPGEAVEVHLKMSSAKPVVVHPVVITCDPIKKTLVWKGALGGAEWVFHGIHSFELEVLEGGRTRFLHQEDMKGLAMPFVRLSGQLKAIREGFLAMNEALKKRCEADEP